MEDVLDVYMRPYDPLRPQVCLDETSIQLVREKRIPLPMAPGRPARFDYEYERNGVCALFMLNEPIRGWREVVVADQRTGVDLAHVIKHLVDVHYPNAEKIVLVMDNLNTHTPGSLYEAFEPTEARRLTDKLEIHYTPKHASWLNMAETELSVLTTQCLDRRIPDKTTLVEEVTAWMHERNVYERSIDWRFTTPDARIKLKRLYPAILPFRSTKNCLKTGRLPGLAASSAAMLNFASRTTGRPMVPKAAAGVTFQTVFRLRPIPNSNKSGPARRRDGSLLPVFPIAGRRLQLPMLQIEPLLAKAVSSPLWKGRRHAGKIFRAVLG